MRQFYKVIDELDEQVTLEPVEAGYVDGYPVGDRLLEGVMFKVTVDAKGKLKAEAAPLSKTYFNDLNPKKWLPLIVEHAETLDIFDPDEVAMSGADHEVILYNTDRPWDDQEACFTSEPKFADGYVPKQPTVKVQQPVANGIVKKLSGVDLVARLKDKVKS